MPGSEAIDQKKLGKLIASAKRIAKQYRRLTGRPLGITGEIGEYEAAKRLGLTLTAARQAGYDATRGQGKSQRKIQIKTRCILKPGSYRGRVPRIVVDKKWDSVILVLLDQDFEPTEMYEASRVKVERTLQEADPTSRSRRGALTISKFRSIVGTPVWSRELSGVHDPKE